MISIIRFRLILLLTCIVSVNLFAGTTGKIVGELHDKETGEPLIGANIIILGTSLGAATDLDGQYALLFVPPGNYDVEVSYIGYQKVTINGVRINIDQTTRLDVELQIETLESEAIVVTAKRDFIKKDVATSVVSVTAQEMEVLPITSIDNVVGLQAGIRGGLSVRSGSASEVLFMMDGVTLRDPRNNEPTTKMALSSVKEISVERGGFNAEYGQVRSGIVNVVSKEGYKDKYSGSLQLRYAPPGPKYQKVKGTLDLHDRNSFVFRPFYDDDVAWTGTDNGAWDKYTKAQYPSFVGWNEISRLLNTDDDPGNDLTPLGAQRAFMYETRKKQPNDLADYDIDAGFGGPVPFLHELTGDMRFFSSYRSTRDVLLFPLSRPDYKDYDWTVRINSDIAPGSSLNFSTLQGKQFTIRHNWDGTGSYYYPHWPNEIANVSTYIGGTTDLIGLFSDFNFALSDVAHQSYALKFSQTLSSKTFYEVSLENFQREYNTRPSALRDTSNVKEILPGYFVDSNPFGYWPYDSKGVIITGGQHVSKARDFTVVNRTTLKANFTSQLDFYNEAKTGFEFNYYDLDFDYGTIASGTAGKTYSSRVQRRDYPIQFSAYAQNKLETEGFTLNAGLRLDYSNANSKWIEVGLFDRQFYTSNYDPQEKYSTKKVKGQFQLSPRLGVSHPITENSKLYFNYGHFKQMPDYERMFRIQRNNIGEMTAYGDPSLTLARTISYELGFDYLIADAYLVNIAAFYRDISNQSNYTTFNITSSGSSYSRPTSNNYEDVKGFELTIRKSYGTWFSGFANYTYIVNSSGNFGSTQIYESPVEQKTWDENTLNQYQDRPIPQPFARANLNFFTPHEFMPEAYGALDDWNLNLLFDWQASSRSTWNPKGLAGVAYNVRNVSYFNLNLRLSKNIKFGDFNAQLFMDMNNVSDELRLWDNGGQSYRASLHLPQSDAYDNIPGNDKIGAYRKPGTEYQPIEQVFNISDILSGNQRAIYYESSTQMYYEFPDAENPGEEVLVDPDRLDKILSEKAYIDMPNASTFWFLSPRRIFYGIRLSYNF